MFFVYVVLREQDLQLVDFLKYSIGPNDPIVVNIVLIVERLVMDCSYQHHPHSVGQYPVVVHYFAFPTPC